MGQPTAQTAETTICTGEFMLVTSCSQSKPQPGRDLGLTLLSRYLLTRLKLLHMPRNSSLWFNPNFPKGCLSLYNMLFALYSLKSPSLFKISCHVLAWVRMSRSETITKIFLVLFPICLTFFPFFKHRLQLLFPPSVCYQLDSWVQASKILFSFSPSPITSKKKA